MTAPGNRFGAHQGEPRLPGQVQKRVQTLLEFRALGVVGKPPKPWRAPPGVGGIGPRTAQSTQSKHVDVADAQSTEGLRQCLAVELRVASRPRHRAHIHHAFHPVLLEQVCKNLERPRGMPDGQDGYRGLGYHASHLELQWYYTA